MRTDHRDPLLRALGLLELQPRRVLIAVAAGVATLGSALALAALSAWLITRAWEMPPVLDLSVAVVAVRALGISRGVFRYLERLTTHDVALRGTTSARARIYARLAAGNPAAAAGLRRGDLLARTGADVDAVGDVVVKALVPIAVSAVLAVSAVGILMFISVPAAMVLAIALAVSGILAPWLSARAARIAESDSSSAAVRFSASAVTALDHSAELRVAGRLDAAVSDAVSAEGDVVDATDRAAVPSAFAAAATPLAVGVSVLASLLIGIVLYGNADMTPMALGILVLLPLSAFEGTAALPTAAVALTKARLASARIMAVLDRADEEIAEGDNVWPESDVLTVDGLCAGWPGGNVTAPLTFDVRPGARIALIGQSGSGKTTALMTMAGLLPPVSGTISAGGVPISEIEPAELRRHIGFFAEDAHLFETSVLENLRVARGDLTPTAAATVLGDVGLGEWLAHLPDGLDTVLVGGMRAVSGGERRRLLLARAVVSPAQILLLDEPTEHMDAEAGAEVLRELLGRDGTLLAPHRTVVVVTHQLPEHTGADQVICVGNISAENRLPSR
ncbi:thiol reductant ABC exporter subunit CydC [Rhodococcus sp. AD45-ID]|uniref:thiol reductant ABC exporter subunit CydC n=1 Tax=unclassified Rhodococcus (in: high G+C Gram-positive bacteria) TaxID=192944 RepID=UPI0005D40366|nr:MULTISPECIES: thiol reductant ABC exporter subunit CydC [unclassified Rhodococcus (in: high G+C Gram-positive bacteria)]KJF21016.1 putative ABC transporter ATP-binding protein [Rhodococcus sp. AD45]PSR38561.1 thiol reductant ABC exporter subunit CydC [Rhodococcus sp. AD45-ID]